MDDFEKLIVNDVKAVIEQNEEALSENCKEAGAKAARLLRQRSRKRIGSYRKGWKADVKKDETGVECVVHNKLYQLTHLLENDHAIRNQTRRTYGTAAGDKVIDGVYSEVSAEFGKEGDGL